MKKRVVAIFFVAVFGLLFQATILARFDLFGLALKPDFLLLLTVTYGLLKGPWYGASMGLLLGLFGDLFIGGVMGLGALAKMGTGFLVGLFEKLIFKDNLLVPAVAAFLASLIADGAFLLLRAALGWPAGSFFPLLARLILFAFYNAILAPLVYRPFYRLERQGDDVAA
ncbi:MAG: rod shape-determining protein MreD [Firmicutes bacterium]|nr:rod shape-determining protein MreD [Bacillota bacterium]